MIRIDMKEIERLEKWIIYLERNKARITEDEIELEQIYNTILQLEEEIIKLKSIGE